MCFGWIERKRPPLQLRSPLAELLEQSLLFAAAAGLEWTGSYSATFAAVNVERYFADRPTSLGLVAAVVFYWPNFAELFEFG